MRPCSHWIPTLFFGGMAVLPFVSTQATLAQFADRPSGERDEPAVEQFMEPYRTVSVASPESGIIEQVFAREGAMVRAGDPLVRLDVDLHEALLAIAEAGKQERGRVQSAQAEVALRQRRFEQLRSLRDAGHARQEEFERAYADVQVAEGQLRTAEELLRLKELEYQKIVVQIERRTIRAPFDGVVTEVFKEPGEFTAANDPNLLKLVQLHPLVATFSPSPDVANTLAAGDAVHVEVAGGTTLPAQVDYVAPVIDAASGTVQVKVRIPNPEGKLRGGTLCRLVLPQ